MVDHIMSKVVREAWKNPKYRALRTRQAKDNYINNPLVRDALINRTPEQFSLASVRAAETRHADKIAYRVKPGMTPGQWRDYVYFKRNKHLTMEEALLAVGVPRHWITDEGVSYWNDEKVNLKGIVYMDDPEA